jgi:hypothetical protein
MVAFTSKEVLKKTLIYKNSRKASSIYRVLLPIILYFTLNGQISLGLREIWALHSRF